jgi:hypothetical protein
VSRNRGLRGGRSGGGIRSSLKSVSDILAELLLVVNTVLIKVKVAPKKGVEVTGGIGI